jgi:L-alanine-DL-glutamate epimerase-like enolase superfamily enzyme
MSAGRTLHIAQERWSYKRPFRVSRGADAALDVILVTLTDPDGLAGRGEAAGVDYDGETAARLAAQVEALRAPIEAGLDRAALAARLPAGGARNALDCALWDLEAKRAGRRAWQLAGLDGARSLGTCVTLGIDSEEAVVAGARMYRDWPLLKVKVDAQRHLEVLRLVHAAAPQAALIVDPNQSWSCEQLNELAPELRTLGVVLIEQPVPRGEDASLRGYRGRIRLAADESLTDRDSLGALQDIYQVINIKLDKSGGLTEALALAREAIGRGLAVMVGCMAGTSLAMAPGMVVGQLAEFVDLDGPLLHSADRPSGIAYERGMMQLPAAVLWG